MKDKPIYVTKPSLPPLEEYMVLLSQIWDTGLLTNNGPFHQQFEEKLTDYLGVDQLSLFTNGTLALITALQALNITGEVITTPYSFVASTHALWWNGIKPVFVDIEPRYLNLDPGKIEAAITPQTTAIMPVHVYGNPCNLDAIQRIADTYGLKVIYDAAHAFGVKLNGTSILNYGDLSVLSFHATKVFTTFEGGAIICRDKELKTRIDFLKNFGFADELTVVGPGINAKMNELQAAFGLLQLNYVDQNISRRCKIAQRYSDELSVYQGIRVLDAIPGLNHNFGYFPIFIDPEEYGKSRNDVYNSFKKKNIYTRRYFYPLISQFPSYKELASAAPDNLPVAEKLSAQVLCLPIYPDLSEEEIDLVICVLKNPW